MLAILQRNTTQVRSAEGDFAKCQRKSLRICERDPMYLSIALATTTAFPFRRFGPVVWKMENKKSTTPSSSPPPGSKGEGGEEGSHRRCWL